MALKDRIIKNSRKLTLITALTVLLTMLSGCKAPGFLYDIRYAFENLIEDIRYLSDEDEEYVSHSERPEEEPEEAPVIDNIEFEPEVNEEIVVIESDDDILGDDSGSDNAANSPMSGILLEETLKTERYYAYHTLDEEEKQIYRLMYSSLFGFAGKTVLPTTDAKLIDKVFACVLADNPELFYVRGYNLVRYERGGKVEKLSISGMFTMDKEEAAVHDKRAEEYAKRCLAGMPASTDDYGKVKYLYEYIIRNTEYDLDAENGQNFISVFENGRSVCQGYACALQYLMNRTGLLCTVVRGVTKDGQNHAWNLIKADGDYYYVDATWGDMSYDLSNNTDSSVVPRLPEVSYEYLCVTDEDIAPTHRLESQFDVPTCDSRRDYYYLREGNYFESVNEEQLRNVFEKGYADGDESVTVKCSTAEVYYAMLKHLADDGHVFDYLHGSGNVDYVTLDNMNELIFYL